ncbi:MAG TPA: hypothetical protein ENJ79_07860 [Gammaproteobacteria bacterium]|nr:hypothetical protein [Gammaproteobacteria bacterium]
MTDMAGRKRAPHFRSARFFFMALETGLQPDGAWVDAITKHVQRPADSGTGTIASDDPPGTVWPSSNGPDQWPARWPDLGRTGDILNLCVCVVKKASNAKIPIGDGSLSPNRVDFSVSWSNGLHILIVDNDGVEISGFASPDQPLVDGETVAIALTLQRGLEARVQVWRSDRTKVVDFALPDPGLGAITPTPVTRITGLAVYGWAGFVFEHGLPSIFNDGVMWALDNWPKKNMRLPPMWKYAL